LFYFFEAILKLLQLLVHLILEELCNRGFFLEVAACGGGGGGGGGSGGGGGGLKSVVV